MERKKRVSKDWYLEQVDPSKAIVTSTGFENLNPKSKDDLPKLMTISETAVYFNKDRKTIEDWRDKKHLFFFRISGTYYTTPQHIADYINKQVKKHG